MAPSQACEDDGIHPVCANQAFFIFTTHSFVFMQTWLGKRVLFDVEALQAPESLDFENLVQISIQTEDDIWSASPGMH